MKFVIESLLYNLLIVLHFRFHQFSIFLTVQEVKLKYCQFHKDTDFVKWAGIV
jgi:hypothetical protein